MIVNTYINGQQVNDAKCFLKKIGNNAMAGVEFADYQRGGVSGQILSRPLYRGFSLNLEYFVKGDSCDDFIYQRDRFIGMFQNSDDPDNYLKTLGFELSNGVVKEIDVVFSQVAGDLNPENVAHSEFVVTAISEREFFTNRDSKTATVQLVAGGGMAVPMPVPMSMANGNTAEITVLNNTGNANSYPTIRVYGEFSASFNLVNDTTGKTFTFSDGLASAHYIDFDFYERTAVKDGTNSVLGDVSGDWWWIAPGTSQVRITSADSLDTGYAEITYKDTYRNL